MSSKADYALMPTYDKPLKARDLGLFLKQYRIWANQQRLTENAQKATLALAFKQESARNWCLINADLAASVDTTFDEFIEKFLQEAPIETTCYAEVIKLITTPPDPKEPVSAHLLRLRCQLSDEWPDDAAKEAAMILYVLQVLPKPLATFIACKDKPATFQDLLSLVRAYEKQGQSIAPVGASAAPVPVEAGVLALPAETAQSLKDMQSMLQVLFHEMAVLKNQSDEPKPVSENDDDHDEDHDEDYDESHDEDNPESQPNYDNSKNFRGNPRDHQNFDNHPYCTYCNRTSHTELNCYQRANDLLMQAQDKLARDYQGRDRGRNRENFDNGYCSYDHNSQWEHNEPLQYNHQQQPPTNAYPSANSGN
ncbi:unnamed protein product [Orchesella dallaii]|uniref:Uncharacterized protein n=1 Tax=Orchesella dallaii TaxID=48710 RepID=A0ABP1R0T2_9HEXA